MVSPHLSCLILGVLRATHGSHHHLHLLVLLPATLVVRTGLESAVRIYDLY